MNQRTGAPDQGGQRKQEIRHSIAMLAIAHRLLDLIPFLQLFRLLGAYTLYNFYRSLTTDWNY